MPAARAVKSCAGIHVYNPAALPRSTEILTVNQQLGRPKGTAQHYGQDADAVEDPPFKPLSREEAQALRAKHPPVSPWRVVGSQALAGVACAALTWVVTHRDGAAWSALYGAAATVLPTALLARGMTRRTSSNPGAAVFGFMFWEMVKIAVAVAMLAAAPRVVPDLNWPALLVAMIVCVKVNWLALLWQRQPVSETKERH
ncbi:MAG: ATP synthase subunit I [Burkholderiales bacterium]|nr:ATP synthase subunit I [Burkholderiales bacterium]